MKVLHNKKRLMGFILMGFAAITTSFASGQVEKSGEEIHITREYNQITDLTLKGISHFSIEEATSPSITIQGDKAYVDALEIQQDGSYLYLEGNPKYQVDVVVKTNNLENIVLARDSKGDIKGGNSLQSFVVNLTGGSELATSNTLEALTIALNGGGATSFEGTVKATDLKINALGSKLIKVDGDVESFFVDINRGEGEFVNLEVQNAFIDAKGNTSVEAAFPGNSSVSVQTASDSSVNLEMNGVLRASVRGDSSLAYAGHVEWVGRLIHDDGTINKL